MSATGACSSVAGTAQHRAVSIQADRAVLDTGAWFSCGSRVCAHQQHSVRSRRAVYLEWYRVPRHLVGQDLAVSLAGRHDVALGGIECRVGY